MARLRKRAKGLSDLLRQVSDQQRIDNVSVELRKAINGCREIVACANGRCEVIARICNRVKEANNSKSV